MVSSKGVGGDGVAGLEGESDGLGGRDPGDGVGAVAAVLHGEGGLGIDQGSILLTVGI